MDPGGTVSFVVSVIQKFIDQYETMKASDEICRKTLQNLKVLRDLLAVVQKQDYIRQPQEVKSAIKQITETFVEYEEKCFQQKGKNKVIRFIRPNKGEQQQMQTDINQCTASLNLALAIAAKEERDREESRRCHAESTEFIPCTSMKALKSLEINRPQCRVDGSVILSWKDSNLNGTVNNYELEIVHDKDGHKCVKNNFPGNQRKFSAEPFTFRPLERYTIRVRAKSVTGLLPSKWSDSVIVRVPQAPPNKPSIPELVTYLCSDTGLSDGKIDSVILKIPLPTEDECNGRPLTSLTVHWSDENSTALSTLHFNNPKKQQFLISNINTDLELTFRVTWSNECGESKYSDSVVLNKDNVVPGEPRNVRESSKKTNKLLKIRWDKPEINAFAVDHYDVHMKNKGSIDSVTTAHKCSATIRNLNQNTNYTFYICSVNGKGKRSSFTSEIVIETKLSNAVKGTLGGLGVAGGIAGGVVGGAVSGPVLGVGAGVLAGGLAAEKVKNKVGKAVVGTLVGVGTAIPSVIGMTLLTPVTMIAAPFTLAATSVAVAAESMEDDWSSQSSDEEEEEEGKKDKEKGEDEKIKEKLVNNDNIKSIIAIKLFLLI